MFWYYIKYTIDNEKVFFMKEKSPSSIIEKLMELNIDSDTFNKICDYYDKNGFGCDHLHIISNNYKI